ncbi:MAG: HPr kinase/phosphorylase, partial [Caulobacteraceae bacterium]
RQPARRMIRHAGLIARRLAGAWRGVLIEGRSGSGKSDLALRALDAGFRLVADDRTVVFVSRARFFVPAAPALRGLIEARGLGVEPAFHLAFAPIALVARCAGEAGAVERLAQPAFETLLGIAVPAVDLWPLAASAPAVLDLAIERLGARRQQAYQARFRA